MLRTIRIATPRFARACSTSQSQESVITALVSSIETAARREVPWFAKQMPPAYFRQVPAGRRDAHLRAITALAAQGISVPEVQLRDPTGKGFTFITDGLDAEATCNLNQSSRASSKRCRRSSACAACSSSVRWTAASASTSSTRKRTATSRASAALATRAATRRASRGGGRREPDQGVRLSAGDGRQLARRRRPSRRPTSSARMACPTQTVLAAALSTSTSNGRRLRMSSRTRRRRGSYTAR